MSAVTTAVGEVDGRATKPQPLVEITVPVYNEQVVLEQSIRTLHDHLAEYFPLPWRIVIADNASTDGTLEIANRLAAEFADVSVVHLDAKGRGRALRAVWSASDADIVGYMDVDLSTKLDALLPLVSAVITGHSQVGTGSRLSPGARVRRRPYREVLSRGYNRLLRWVFGTGVRDAQCGFKVMPAVVAQQLLGLVHDNEWFFDTELLLTAEALGMRVLEIPVDWVEDTDSRVHVPKTVWQDLRGVARVVRRELAAPLAGRSPELSVADRGLARQLGSFCLVGVVSTVAYVLLYLLLHSFGAMVANAVALLVCTAGNIAANRRFTFGRYGPRFRVRETVESWGVALLAILLSDSALRVLLALRPGTGVRGQLVVAVVATGVVTLLRFLVMRRWVFDPRRRAASAAADGDRRAAHHGNAPHYSAPHDGAPHDSVRRGGLARGANPGPRD